MNTTKTDTNGSGNSVLHHAREWKDQVHKVL